MKKRHKQTSNMDEKFKMRYVISENGCWVWTASMRHNATPIFPSNSGKLINARAFSFEKYIGDVFIDMPTFDTVCGNAACVNPEHIILRDKSETQRIGWEKNHQRKTKCDVHGDFTPSRRYRECPNCIRVRAEAWRNSIVKTVICAECGKEFGLKRRFVNRSKHFCSRGCSRRSGNRDRAKA